MLSISLKYIKKSESEKEQQNVRVLQYVTYIERLKYFLRLQKGKIVGGICLPVFKGVIQMMISSCFLYKLVQSVKKLSQVATKKIFLR